MAAARAALEAAFGRRYKQYLLHKTLVQDKLVEYFAGRGEAAVDLPFDVDRDDETEWKDRWLTGKVSIQYNTALTYSHTPHQAEPGR